MGLYGQSQLVRKYCNNAKEQIRFNIHFNHIQYSLVEIDRFKDLFLQEVKIGKQFGATYGVHHMAKYPMTGQKGYWKQLIDEVVKRMMRVEDICQEASFAVYIENTFESVEFYQTVFERLNQNKTQFLHFCFDIGHAKVWSGDSFDTWMIFLQKLKEMGFKIHFHLHANRGLIDEHLSPLEIDDYDGNDGVFSDKTYKEMFQEIISKFPNEPKIFEVKPTLAIENREWIEQNL